MFGSVLASIVQSELFSYNNISPLTWENLVSQLKKEQIKEKLECNSSSCVQEIITGFGLADSIFGIITNMGNQYNISLTWFHQNEIISAVNGICKANNKLLIKRIKSLAHELAQKGLNRYIY